MSAATLTLLYTVDTAPANATYPLTVNVYIADDAGQGQCWIRSLTYAEAQAQSKVFDVLGCRVTVLHEGEMAAGPHPLTLDASGLPAGLYVVRATAASATLTQRITVVR